MALIIYMGIMVENKFLIKDKEYIDNLNTLNWICLWQFSGRNMQ